LHTGPRYRAGAGPETGRAAPKKPTKRGWSSKSESNCWSARWTGASVG